MPVDHPGGVQVVIVQVEPPHPVDCWGDQVNVDEVLGGFAAAGINASTIVVRGASDLAGVAWADSVAFANARRYCDCAGRSHSLIQLLQEHDIRLVGCDLLGHRAENKVYMKTALAAHGLPTPPWALVSDTSAAAVDGLRFPVIVKPEAGAISLGVERVDEPAALDAALQHTRDQFGPCRVLVEEFVREREYSVAVIGNGDDRQGFPLEIVVPASLSFFNTEAKVQLTATMPPRPVTDDVMSSRLCKLAIDTCSVLEIEDWSRVDILEDSAGDLYVIDVNTMPGLRHRGALMSGFPSCLHVARSMTYAESTLAIVGVALLRHNIALPGPIQAALEKLGRPPTAGPLLGG